MKDFFMFWLTVLLVMSVAVLTALLWAIVYLVPIIGHRLGG